VDGADLEHGRGRSQRGQQRQRGVPHDGRFYSRCGEEQRKRDKG
jgi:hypothetical protein